MWEPTNEELIIGLPCLLRRIASWLGGGLQSKQRKITGSSKLTVVCFLKREGMKERMELGELLLRSEVQDNGLDCFFAFSRASRRLQEP
jgi:hypothetical protein